MTNPVRLTGSDSQYPTEAAEMGSQLAPCCARARPAAPETP